MRRLNGIERKLSGAKLKRDELPTGIRQYPRAAFGIRLPASLNVRVPELTVTPGVAALQSVLALVKVAGSKVPKLRKPLPASAMTEPKGFVPDPPD